ncbi:MAG: flavin reductase family protein [Desulfobacteraceae bacterium]|nr:MAG: flavin reductase family protein [Desulfobacteraceae bacterium]
MEKIEIGADRLHYPMPCSLIGANVEGRANYLTVAWFSMANPKPPYVMAAMNKAHYTNAGVKANGAFSVNIPSAELVEKMDYCGMVSGRKTDKGGLFKTFYGKLQTAPMIEECAFNAECRLVQTVDLPMEEIFIGEIVGAYCAESCLTDGIPDMRKINPLLLNMPVKMYAVLGRDVAPAWGAGKKLMK